MMKDHDGMPISCTQPFEWTCDRPVVTDSIVVGELKVGTRGSHLAMKSLGALPCLFYHLLITHWSAGQGSCLALS